MQLVYLFPTKEGFWLAALEGKTARSFQTRDRALEYARTIAKAQRPSAVIELTAAGDQVSREDFP